MTYSACIHRYYLFVSNTTARAFVVGLFEEMGNGGAAESLNLAEPVLCLATDPPNTAPSVWANSFVATEEQRAALSAIESSMPSGVNYVRVDNYTDAGQGLAADTVRASNFTWGEGQVGSIFDWTACLSALGLAMPALKPMA
jgi:hypothetical protein